MKLQISSQLAIFALLDLAAKPDEQLTVAQIGEKYGVSSHHLAKVIHVLGRAGLVRSVRGAKGGYQFSSNSRRTTLLDVIQLFEDVGPSEMEHTGLPEASDTGRALQQVLGEINAIAQATLGSVTIATMLKLVASQRTRARELGGMTTPHERASRNATRNPQLEKPQP